jgi:hypothetical protein
MLTDVENFNYHVYRALRMTNVHGIFFVAEYLVTGLEYLDTLKPWL